MFDFPQSPFIICKHNKVIYVAQVEFAPELFLYKVIEPVQVNVAKILAGQIAYGQAFMPLNGRKQIVAGEMSIDVYLRVAEIYETVDEP